MEAVEVRESPGVEVGGLGEIEVANSSVAGQRQCTSQKIRCRNSPERERENEKCKYNEMS